MREWFYFGCGREAGHHLFKKNKMTADHNPLTERLQRLDGDLAPAFNRQLLYHAAFSRLGALGYSAVSWWDHTVDTRTGSNSTIFAPTLFTSKDDILYYAKPMFPWVFSRLPQELVWWEPETPPVKQSELSRKQSDGGSAF